ncbi:MAG: zinc ribbon domain-containing protein [Spirochaetales bacterium]
MKKCPACAEEIQDEATKCKHCGEVLDKVLNETAASLIEDSSTDYGLKKPLSIWNVGQIKDPKKFGGWGKGKYLWIALWSFSWPIGLIIYFRSKGKPNNSTVKKTQISSLWVFMIIGIILSLLNVIGRLAGS